MRTIRAELDNERSYDIIVASGSLPSVGEEVAGVCAGRAAVVVMDSNTGPLYGNDVMESLRHAGFQTFAADIPAGEENKTLETATALYNRLLDVRLDRSGIVVTLGGGVVGDLGGFVAATYMRGIDFVQIPTTFLAQIDASIGGKVGVDLPRGKNLVGAFHQPKLVLIDPDVLATLPQREMTSGLAELIKYGIIADRGLFDFVESQTEALRRLDRDVLEEAIARSCEIKAAIVSQDEKESGIRALLNYGHTVGHGIEVSAGFGKYSHGEAVAIGMVSAAMISEAKTLAPSGTARQIADLLEKVGLPTVVHDSVDTEAVMRAIGHDKKVRLGKLRFVLPKSIGTVVVSDNVNESDVRQALAEQHRLFSPRA